MKKGNACHMDMWDVMGNRNGDLGGDVKITLNGMELVVPRSYYTRVGKLRKSRRHEVAEALLAMHRRAKKHIAA
jgi:hypothetical protein